MVHAAPQTEMNLDFTSLCASLVIIIIIIFTLLYFT